MNAPRVLAVIGLASAVPALWAPHVGAAVTAAIRDVDLDHAYFPLMHGWLFYLALPVVVMSSVVLILTPGLLVASLIGRARSVWEWLLDGFLLTSIIVSLAAASVQALMGRPLTGRMFVVVLAGIVAALSAAVFRRTRGNLAPAWPSHPHAGFALAMLVAVPVLFLVSMLPKFFWEAFNGDGAHTLEATRLLLYQPLPFFAADAGIISSWPGLNGMLVPYQASWFLRLFGDVEAAVRLPLLLDMALLAAAIAGAAEAGRSARLSRAALVLAWGSVTSFSLAMSFAATYNPYSAEVSMPAPQDTLVMVSALAAVGAFAERDWPRLSAWVVMCLLLSPAGLLILGASVAGLWLVNGWRAWRRTLPFAIGLAAAVVAVLAATALLHRVGILQGGGEHSAVGLLMRQFGAIALLDVERVLWALIPSGLYPAAVLLMWKSSDEPGRVLIAATGLLFAFFYPMGEISLHYFVPVMVLPVAAFWRRWAGPVRWGPAAWAACTGAAAVAIYLALPRGSAVYDGTRLVGERIDVSALGGYHTNDPAALRATEALSLLWPNDAHPDVPDRRYGDSPLAWNYYAQRRPTSAATSYVLLPAGATLPPGAASAGKHESAVVGVYDHPAWMRDRALVPRRSQAKPILTVPRHVLFFDPQASPRAGFLQPHTWPWLRRLAGKSENH